MEDNQAMKTDYGSYLTVTEVGVPLASASALGMLSLLPGPRVVKLALRALAAASGAAGLYTAYLAYTFAEHMDFKEDIRASLIDRLAWDGQGKGLDIGTGSGLMAIGLAKRFPQAQVYGVDTWNAGFIGVSQERARLNAVVEDVASRVRFEPGSASRLPYAYGEFDAVVSNLVFHDVVEEKNKLVLMLEALRVLKPGGVFAFNDIFLNRLYFPDIRRLIDAIKAIGLQSLETVRLSELVRIPKPLRPLFSTAVILYGVK